MSLSTGNATGTYGPFYTAGAPSNGTNEVQTLTIGSSPSAGTFTLTFNGFTTGAITWSSNNTTLLANINAALLALPNVDTSDWTATAGTVSSGVGTILITAGGNLAKKDVTLMTTDYTALTGGTTAVATTTAGVTATARGAAPGALLIDTTNNIYYRNTGTALAPTWSASQGSYTNDSTTAVNTTVVATNQAATATNVAEARTGFAFFNGPAAPSTTNIVSTVNLTNIAFTIAAQPDWPRKLTITVVDTTPSITAGTVTVIGVDASGNAQTDALSIAAGAATYTTTKAFASVTSITASGVTTLGGAGDETIAVGGAGALGLPGCKTPTPSAFAVHKANLDKVGETVGTVDATAGTITPTTAANGTRTFAFWYTYAVTGTQSSHTHTQDTHNHTQSSHTHTTTPV